jgi:uncharacterized protein YkwD
MVAMLRGLRRLTLIAGVSVALGWMVMPASPAAAAGDCTVSSADLAINGDEQALLNLINAYRQQQGLNTLTSSPALNRAAAWLSRDMATKQYSSHTDSLGRDRATRIGDCGYSQPFDTAENIAAGYSDPVSVFSGWKGSQGHNDNMLTPHYTVAGVARTTSPSYWTLTLGSYNDSGKLVATFVPGVQLQLPPAAPSNLWTPTGTGTSILLVWDDKSANETEFHVSYREVGQCCWQYQVIPGSADATGSWYHQGLQSGRVYEYSVKACNGRNVNCSPWVGPVTMRTCSPSPCRWSLGYLDS